MLSSDRRSQRVISRLLGSAVAIALSGIIGGATYQLREADVRRYELNVVQADARLNEAVTEQQLRYSWILDSVSPTVAALQTFLRLGETGDGEDPHLSSIARELLLDRMQHRGDIDHIRLISLGGDELVRVNRRGAGLQVVPESALQNKSQRAYLTDAIADLKSSDVFLSRIDLNVEQGVIESPHKPVVRILERLNGPGDQAIGLVAANITAPHQRMSARSSPTESGERIYKLDSFGFFLDGDGKYRELEFSWQLEGATRGLDTEAPILWGAIQQEPTGQLNAASLRYRWQSISPTLPENIRISEQSLRNIRITILQETPWDVLYAGTVSIGPGAGRFFAGVGLLWLLSVIVSYRFVRLALERQYTRLVRTRADIANRAAGARRELLAIISHELRTPAASLAMLIVQTGSELPTRQSWRRVTALTHQIIGLLDDLRATPSGLSHEHIRLKRVHSSLRATVEHGLELARPMLEAHDISTHFSSEVSSDTDTWIDRFRVATILENLAHNTVEHGGARSIHVHCWMIDKEDGFLAVIKFEDDGAGVSPELVSSIFERGVSNKEQYGESGLGLYIVQEWVTALGGIIKYFPSRHGGAGFEISFPLLPGSYAPAQVDLVTLDTDPSTATSLQGIKILSVEDDPLIQELTVSLLQRLGADVWVADDGHDALNVLASSDPDVLLIDASMPAMGGVELITKLRQDGVQTPVIGVTAISMESTEHDLMEAGADAYLLKPITATEIQRIISALGIKKLEDDEVTIDEV